MSSTSTENTKFYVDVTPIPTQKAPKEVRYDFNLGARISLPKRKKGVWSVTLLDIDTGNILFHDTLTGGTVSSSKRFFVNFRIEVDEIEDDSRNEILRHSLNLFNQKVVIQCPVSTIGDTLAWFPYVVQFAEKHKAKIYCILDEKFIDLFQPSYPELILITKEQAEKTNLLSESYACYYLGLFFKDKEFLQQPTDFRVVGLNKTAAYILGLPTDKEQKLSLKLPDNTRPIKEKYVCISVHASAQCKYWNNPKGWEAVVQFLKQLNYRVICIDLHTIYGHNITWNSIPHDAEDETGNRPLAERARWLKHADFFIGVSSGLSWLAWTMNTPIVMISGFTHPINEFYTPYRIINWHVCNSCWNDLAHDFDHNNFLWCPRHENTLRQFECSKTITADFVIQTIQRLIADRK